MTFLSLALTDGDFTEIAIVGIHDSVPCDGGGVNVQSGELTNLSTAQITRVPVFKGNYATFSIIIIVHA